MFIMYVDESGDTGLNNSPTRYFILTGLVLHETDWHSSLQSLKDIRTSFRDNFSFKLRNEFHASELLNKPGKKIAALIPKNERLQMIRIFSRKLSALNNISLINIVVDKHSDQIKSRTAEEVFRMAWGRLIQRFENTIKYGNFPSSANKVDCGLIIHDSTHNEMLRGIQRGMRAYNPVPNIGGTGSRNLEIRYIIEDVNPRNSKDSYFIQACDLSAYLLFQKLAPNKYMKKKGGHKYFDKLEPVLFKQASRTDPNGIVWCK